MPSRQRRKGDWREEKGIEGSRSCIQWEHAETCGGIQLLAVACGAAALCKWKGCGNIITDQHWRDGALMPGGGEGFTFSSRTLDHLPLWGAPHCFVVTHRWVETMQFLVLLPPDSTSFTVGVLHLGKFLVSHQLFHCKQFETLFFYLVPSFVALICTQIIWAQWPS